MNQTWKRLGALAAALALCASITACTPGAADPAPSQTPAQSPVQTPSVEPQSGADLVITNAAVYTVDAADTTAQAVAVEDGVIIYVGGLDGVQSYITDDTRVVDAAGGTVMPGMIDAHMHPAYNAVSFMYEIYLGDMASLDDYLAAIQAFVDEHPDDASYAGTGFSRSVWDSVGPRKESLDAICDDKPIIIRSGDGHSYWVNSYVLEQAGITKDTPDPEGGVIQRDPVTGEPSGLLQESGAMDLVADQKRAYTLEEYKEAILWVQDWFAEMGLTTVFDAMIPLDNPNYYMAYQELAEEGRLTVRIRGAWHLFPEMADSAEELEAMVDKGIALSKGFTTDYFQVGAFKFFADQVLEEETAYLAEPYSHRSDGWQGLKVWDDAAMERLFTKIDAAGFQIHVHQIGDGAATYTLDAIEKAVAANGARDSRHTFAHLQLISDADQQRLADLGMCAIIAPYWMQGGSYYDELYLPYLGQERAESMYPAQSLIDKGVHVSTHSDFAVSIPNATELFYESMYRTISEKTFLEWYGADSGYVRATEADAEPGENVMLPLPRAEERMTLDEAVRAATWEGAYAHFLEDETGSIEVGKKADLLMFDKDLFALDAEEMSWQEPRMTLFEGQIVYDAGE